jgi:DNA mismatch repair protein MutS2
MSRHLDRLEFDGLRAILSRYVLSEIGRTHLRLLHPQTDVTSVRERYALLSDMRRLLQDGVRLDFSPIPDLSGVLEKAKVAGMLQGMQLYVLSDLLERAEEFYERCLETGLQDVQSDPQILRQLRYDIKAKIMPDGELHDGASPDLRRIREGKHARRQEVHDLLNSLMDRYSKRGLLRDRVVTLRNGRFVLPFTSHARQQGVVHGFSKSEETVYVEPMESIDAQNRYVRLIEEEREEEERILRELSARVTDSHPLLQEIYDGIGRLEVIYAEACFAEDFGGIEPTLNDRGRIFLEEARHPLLTEARGHKAVIPLDVDVDPGVRVLLISGPNAGGKTVAVKTVGLLVLMAACGLPVPAKRADIFVPKRVFAIGFEDEQNISSGESSFTSLLNELKDAVIEGGQGDLVLLDEFLASTDPREGSALGFSILSHLKEKGAKVFANTHLTPMKVLVEKEEGMDNATMGFDPDTRSPTYRLTMGEMGVSHAFEIARRVGFPMEVVNRAEAKLTGIEEEIADLIQSTRDKEARAEQILRAAEAKERALSRKEEQLLKKSRIKAKAMLEESQRRVEKMIKEIGKEGTKRKRLAKAREIRKNIVEEKEMVAHRARPARMLTLGRTYRVRGLGINGELLEKKEGTVILKVGKTRLEVPREALYEVQRSG